MSSDRKPPARRRSDPFGTDHLKANLRSQSLRGGAVTLLGQFVKFVLQFGSTAILARILAPEDFGLVAMVTAITGLAVLLKDLGLTMATVQRDTITQDQVSALFWVNLVVSTVLTVITIAAAPIVASIYGEPRLAAITAALGATLLLGGVAAQHSALIRRQMRFKALAAIEVGSLITAIIAAVTIALLGGGYWALVALHAVREGAQALATWAASGWKPSRPKRNSGAGGMLRFGAHLSGFSIVNYVGRNVDDALIGWRWGPDDAGIYNRAYSLLMMPLRQINQPVAAVAIPVLSRLQTDPERFRTYYVTAVRVLSYATVPLIALMGALSDEIVLALLGPGWEEAGAVFAVLAIAAVGQPVLSTAGWVWTATGHTKQMFRWALISDPIIVLSFAIGLRWGPIGVATTYAIAVNGLLIPGLAYAYRGTLVRLKDVWGACLGPATLALSMFVGAILVREPVAHLAALPRVAAVLGAAAVTGGMALVAWPRLRREVFGVIGLVQELRTQG